MQPLWMSGRLRTLKQEQRVMGRSYTAVTRTAVSLFLAKTWLIIHRLPVLVRAGLHQTAQSDITTPGLFWIDKDFRWWQANRQDVEPRGIEQDTCKKCFSALNVTMTSNVQIHALYLHIFPARSTTISTNHCSLVLYRVLCFHIIHEHAFDYFF